MKIKKSVYLLISIVFIATMLLPAPIQAFGQASGAGKGAQASSIPSANAADLNLVQIPVILLPGMTASVNWSCFLIETGCEVESLWGWSPTAEDVYHSLIASLEAAGYTEENHYFSVFFYDWRKPLADNIYRLDQLITTVTTATGTDSVDLIGHSMGGVVSRAYIQSDSYDGDVSHLVTLGSPHYGAARAYPYWQAAYFYEMSGLERIVFGVLLVYYMARDGNPIPVYALRDNIPSLLDILPTEDYLYDNDTNLLIPESGMIHRNLYLAFLDDNLAQLFARVDVATFAGTDQTTTDKFYVRDRYFWEWPNWDDGKPNWAREDEFKTLLGDGTVSLSSATLPPPALVEEFALDHNDLPGDPDVISAIFTYLGIPFVPSTIERIAQSALVLTLDGPAGITITDPAGRKAGLSELQTVEPFYMTVNPKEGSTTLIPGAEAMYVTGEKYTLVIIPQPLEGRYEVEVNGTGSGKYSIGLLDTFDMQPSTVSDIRTLWDASTTQIEPSAIASYAFTYTPGTPAAANLLAQTPVIEYPVWVGDVQVSGRALPNSTLEIYDADTQVLLGSGFTGEDGHFSVSLSSVLAYHQRIYAVADGSAGLPFTVQSYVTFIPFARR